jgi:four helix bundle protein
MNSEVLNKRLKNFANNCIKLATTLPNSFLGNYIRNQLTGCSTSAAANYRATCLAKSKTAFISKLSIVLEETYESLFWLEFINDKNY